MEVWRDESCCRLQRKDRHFLSISLDGWRVFLSYSSNVQRTVDLSTADPLTALRIHVRSLA